MNVKSNLEEKIKEIKKKKLIAFDVDGTIAKSRSKIDAEMAELLKKLLITKKVAIITGGAFADIEKQVLSEIGLNNELNNNLILLPTNGGSLQIFDGTWKELSSSKFTPEEKKEIISAIKKVEDDNLEFYNEKVFGKKIQDRNSQITYSALGDQAPTELKYAWDPDLKKKIKLQAELKKSLPNFEVNIGGKTSIDITIKGIDKAFAVQKAMNYLNLEKNDVLFIGDAVYENGNDFPVTKIGIDTIKVTNHEDTKKVIGMLIT